MENQSVKVFDMGKYLGRPKPASVSFPVKFDVAFASENFYSLFQLPPPVTHATNPPEATVAKKTITFAVTDRERLCWRTPSMFMVMLATRLRGSGFDLKKPYREEHDPERMVTIYTQEVEEPDEFRPYGDRSKPSTAFKLTPVCADCGRILVPPELPFQACEACLALRRQRNAIPPERFIVAENNTGRTIQPGEPVYFTLPGPKRKSAQPEPQQPPATEPAPKRRAINRRKKP